MTKTNIKLLERAGAGRATRITVQAFSNDQVLTAVRDGSGNLKLIGWLTPNGEKITRAADTEGQAGEVSEIALALVSPPQSPVLRAITAVRDGSGNLKLISWEIGEQMKSITRLKHSLETDAGAATHITLVAGVTSPNALGPVLITAIRADNGNLKLISWRLLPDGSFTRLGDSEQNMHQAGEVGLIAACSLGYNSVMTAVRAGNGDLKLIKWYVSDNGEMITRQGDSEQYAHQAGYVDEINIVPAYDSEGGSYILTAVRSASGTMKVIAWNVLERQADKETGTASHISIAFAHTGAIFPIYLTSMRNGSGDLALIAFELSRNGGVTRTGEYTNAFEFGDVDETALEQL
jgi:hypothetical protein